MESETTRAFFILSGVFGSFGLLFLLLGIWQFRTERAFARIATEASGIVAGFRTRALRRRGARRGGFARSTPLDFPLVRYVTNEGQTIEFESALGTRPRIHREGQAVTVLYDPAAPQRAQIASGGWMYGLPLVFTLVGAGMLAFSVLFGSLAWFLGG